MIVGAGVVVNEGTAAGDVDENDSGTGIGDRINLVGVSRHELGIGASLLGPIR